VSDPIPSASLTDSIPDPPTIRTRLRDLAAEANFLRALLRLLEHRECGRRVLQRRRIADRREAANA
jgi:hypothetical protein